MERAYVEELHSWILALLGERGTEAMSPTKAEAVLVNKGVPSKDGAAMAKVVVDVDLARIAEDAGSLKRWLSRAESVLPVLVSRK